MKIVAAMPKTHHLYAAALKLTIRVGGKFQSTAQCWKLANLLDAQAWRSRRFAIMPKGWVALGPGLPCSTVGLAAQPFSWEAITSKGSDYLI
jgi:hypothetical protein